MASQQPVQVAVRVAVLAVGLVVVAEEESGSAARESGWLLVALQAER